MTTWTATIQTDEASGQILAEAIGEDADLSALPLDLAEAADGGWRVTLYFEGQPPDESAEALHRLVRTTLGGKSPEPVIASLPETDWVAKSLEGLRPVRVGRFFVHGQHDRTLAPANAVAVEIEAAQAFGTGHHGSTAGCLAALELLARRRDFAHVLDLGTGSGVLAIAAAKLWHSSVLATDIDPVAARLARENARLNRVGHSVTTIAAPGFRHALFTHGTRFELVVANILAGPLAGLATELARRVKPGGFVVLSGLLPSQRRMIVAAYTSRGLRLVRPLVVDGWLTLILARHV